jgi:lysophospholipase L1-like esterase
MELPSPEAPKRAAGLPTTTPVTQDRDRAIYNWQTRHEEILARHREVKPDVVIVGDSIIHYCGGEPNAPMARAPQAWSNCFAGLKVTNLSYGWDRTENVLWRIDHGELDGIAPKAIVIKIGTNNTGINTPEEISAGIEAVCAAAHAKQPDAKILLFGILARKDEKAPRPAITDKVNRLLIDRLSGIPWIALRDIGDQLRNPDGTPNVKLFADGVHIDAAATISSAPPSARTSPPSSQQENRPPRSRPRSLCVPNPPRPERRPVLLVPSGRQGGLALAPDRSAPGD